jgi:hypothetical protein
VKSFACILVLLWASVSHAQQVSVAQCGGGCCQGWGCPGGICYPAPQPRYQPHDDGADERRGAPPQYELRPKQPLPAAPIATPPLPPPPSQPTEPACDCGPKLEALIAAVKAGGCKCDNAKLEASIAALTEAVKAQPHCDTSKLEAKIDQLITVIGNQQPPVPPADATQPKVEEHVVIVADHNAPYWQRLAEAIANAKKTYSGIQDTTLPTFPIGNHPQAVVYRNSVPVRIVKGQYEVEALLSRLARGEPI